MLEIGALRLLAPLGLLFLAAVPVILWLHLRRRRPARVVVPSLAPWLALTRARPPRRRRIPPSVLLALHLAAAIGLALAIADPTLPGAAGSGRDRAVVVDVTTSMTAGNRWSTARERARALVDGAAGAVTLVTLEARPRVLVARDADGRAARAALAALEPGGTGADTAAALALAAAAAGPDAEIVGVTDGAIPPPSPGLPGARWEGVGEPADNLAVIDAAARTTGGETRVFARAASFAAVERSATLRLVVDGRDFEGRTVTLAPGATHDVVWSVPPGARTAEVRLDAGDALPADDAADLPLEGGRVAIQLSGTSHAVERALAAIPNVALERLGPATLHGDGSVPVTVLVGAVPDRLPPGGVLVVRPEPGGWLGARPDGASGRADEPGAHPLVAGLDLLGVALAGLNVVDVPPWAEPVLWADGLPAVLVGEPSGTRVVVLAFDPDAGGVADRLAFPLLVARAVAWVAPPPLPAAVDAGAPVAVPPGALVRGGGRETRAPNGWFEATRRPGLYAVDAPGADARPSSRFAVHAGDVVESDLRERARLTDSALGSRAPRAGGASGSGREADGGGGRPLWPWLAVAAAAAMLAESVWRELGAGRRP